MGGIKELTPYQIADAFPDECKEFIPRALIVFESKLLDIKFRLQMVDAMRTDESNKKLYRMFVDCDAPRKYTKLIEKYKKTMEVLKDLETKKYLDNTHKIAKAKARPIETLIVLEKQKMGTNRIHGCCPLGHIDSTPSFVIYRGTNTFHCFSCKAGGDSIEFFMRINNCDFESAIKELSK